MRQLFTILFIGLFIIQLCLIIPSCDANRNRHHHRRHNNHSEGQQGGQTRGEGQQGGQGQEGEYGNNRYPPTYFWNNHENEQR
ncbi:hypothetical protein HUG17_10487 [Dermatophagoides farinae]|uniref:Uncharacterized protein n=1 Tax=Dermatophagoides farinae TaxID=6954 RepID=A0A9D4SBI1_DERFA|nr:hypothetical protein HUG17_10487 [Dermatophagoides farinae]